MVNNLIISDLLFSVFSFYINSYKGIGYYYTKQPKPFISTEAGVTDRRDVSGLHML